MKSIAIITARSGSKGMQDKNIKELCGHPLMSYSINSAKQSGMFDKVFVSTDSKKYAEIAMKYEADASFLRSKQNSSDTAKSWDVIKEVIYHFESRGEFYDVIALLQPTSPLRTAEDIQNCFNLLQEKNANSIRSVTEMEHSPLWCNTLDEDLCMDNFHAPVYAHCPRQKLPIYYRLNGAIYLIKREELDAKEMFTHKSYAYIMPNERSVDIDTPMDFKIIEMILKKEYVIF